MLPFLALASEVHVNIAWSRSRCRSHPNVHYQRKSKTLLHQALRLLIGAFLGLSGRTHAAPGDVDRRFDAGSMVNQNVRASALQPDGKLIIGGYFSTVRGAARNRIARLNSDGTCDTSFDPGAGANDGVVS